MNAAVAQLAEATTLKVVKFEFESRLPHQFVLRLLKKIKIEKDCAIWIGAISPTGYGKIKFDAHARDVHRVIGELIYGPLETTDMICHSNQCVSRACIRIPHLYKGNRSTNMKDALSLGTAQHPNRYKLFCKYGHEFNEENTYIDKNGNRHCRVCNKLEMQETRKELKEVIREIKI